jgi:hypothetical protein
VDGKVRAPQMEEVPGHQRVSLSRVMIRWCSGQGNYLFSLIAVAGDILLNIRLAPLTVLLAKLLQHAMLRGRIEGASAQVFTLALMLHVNVDQGVDQRRRAC